MENTGSGKNMDDHKKREPNRNTQKRKNERGGNENRAENNDNADTVPDQRDDRPDAEEDEKERWRAQVRGKIASGKYGAQWSEEPDYLDKSDRVNVDVSNFSYRGFLEC